MPNVFVSYRRADSPHVTGRLRDQLVLALGEENVFYDVDSIALGEDFREAVRDSIERVDALLVVIGHGWSPERLIEEDDPVRNEIRAALEFQKRIVPILIDGERMPAREELPDDVSAFSFRNAQVLRGDPDFRTDVERLLRALGASERGERLGTPRTTPERRRRGPARMLTLATTVFVVLLVGALIAIAAFRSEPQDSSAEVLQTADARAWFASRADISEMVALRDGRVAIGIYSNLDNGISLWDPRTPEASAQIVRDVGYWTIAVLPDGRLATPGNDLSTIELWNPDNPGGEHEVLAGHGDTVLHITTMPDGRLASVAKDDKLIIWDVDDRSIERTFDYESIVLDLTSHPDGYLLVATRDSGIEVIDVLEGRLVTRLSSESSARSVDVLPNGDVVSGHDDGVARVWSIRFTDPLYDTEPHDEGLPVRVVRALPDGRVASGTMDLVRVWTPNRTLDEPLVLWTGGGYTTGIVLDGSNKLVASASSRIVRFDFP